ncbi:hypothetical protein [Streptomyces scopuliridis]|uniref:hypothetical protein n=1 Tax=Streptomyces scopuliridis TaxID=452529 RepID=UPI0036B204E6
MREVHVPPVWTDADAFVGEVPDWFRLDRTRGQEHAVYVAAEKDTLRQLPTDWLADLGIPVLVSAASVASRTSMSSASAWQRAYGRAGTGGRPPRSWGCSSAG